MSLIKKEGALSFDSILEKREKKRKIPPPFPLSPLSSLDAQKERALSWCFPRELKGVSSNSKKNLRRDGPGNDDDDDEKKDSVARSLTSGKKQLNPSSKSSWPLRSFLTRLTTSVVSYLSFAFEEREAKCANVVRRNFCKRGAISR